MNMGRKVHKTKRRGHSKKWAIFASILIIITLVAAAYVWFPKNESNSFNVDPAFKAFTDHYLDIMKNLNSTETKEKMAIQLNPNFNQTDLFAWEQSKLTFANDPNWFENPTQILNSGDGICMQWSIVYVSACLALGYQSRLVVAVDTLSWNFIHAWAEDYYNGTWVHVDPSDKVWNNPLRYLSWDWGSSIGSQVKIYAFEDSTFQDVTSTYSR
jgi:hypothetical protein